MQFLHDLGLLRVADGESAGSSDGEDEDEGGIY